MILFKKKDAKTTEDQKVRSEWNVRFVVPALFREGKYEEAVKELLKAIKCDPHSIDAHILLGSAYTVLKKYAQSEAELIKAIQLAPGSAECHYAFGQLHYAQNKHAEASSEYGKAVSLSPDDAGYRAMLARSCAESQQLEKAEKEARWAVHLAPNNVDSHDALAWVFFRQSQAAKLLQELEVVESLGGSITSRELLPSLRKAKTEGRLE